MSQKLDLADGLPYNFSHFILLHKKLLTLLIALILDSAEIRSSATSTFPYLEAQCSGVHPSFSD